MMISDAKWPRVASSGLAGKNLRGQGKANNTNDLQGSGLEGLVFSFYGVGSKKERYIKGAREFLQDNFSDLRGLRGQRGQTTVE